MKKKPLTSYPSIPTPKVDQFTLPELAVQLLRNKQFTKGIQTIFSNCIITSKSQEPLPSPNILTTSKDKSFKSPKTPQLLGKTQKMSKSLTNNTSSQNFPLSLQLQTQEQTGEVEFIFERQTKNKMMYPWAIGDNGKEELVQCNLITDEITDFIQEAIECGLHKVLNKQFINVTNEILAMREQMSIFTRQELQRTDSVRQQVKRQLQKMQKKIQQQQHISTSILNQPLERFSRSKGVLNNSLSNNSTKESTQKNDEFQDTKTSIHHEVHALKKQIQAMKKSMTLNSQSYSNNKVGNDTFKLMEEKIYTTEQKLTELNLSVKLVLEQQKQKCRKGYEQLCSQLASTTSKQFLSQQVKKSVKSNLKIYLDQIMKCKKDIEDLYERIQRNDKGMQQYIGNQLKNVWTLVSGIKTRVENIEDQFNVGMDQSFVL